jgi:hypothetical protein
MALLHLSAAVEDLGYLTDQQKNSGDLKYYVYVSVIDSSGKPVSGLTKQNFGLVMFDGIETVTLNEEFDIKHFAGQQLKAVPGFYGLQINRNLKNEAVLPESRLFGLTVTNDGDAGQTIFRVSYLKQ